MDRKLFNEHVKEVFERTEKVLVRKGDEYSSESNVFHNFEAARGISLHNSSVAVAWEFTVKHLQSIKDIITLFENEKDTSKISNELIEEKFGDAINYFILMEGMIKEQLKNK